MLKITTVLDHGMERVLKLEGKLLADWVTELYEACRRARTDSGPLQLDLGELAFADASGTMALRELIRQGVSITATSPLVGELLKESEL